MKKRSFDKKEKPVKKLSLFQKFLFLFLMVTLFGLFYFLTDIYQEKGRYLKNKEYKEQKKDNLKQPSGLEIKGHQPGTLQTENLKEGKLVIVIDDLGQDEKTAKDFINLGYKLTISILPELPYSTKIAKNASDKKLPVILHLPLEPKGYPKLNPGKGALLTSMNNEEMALIFFKDIESVPFLSGVNNHMGSKFTEESDKMRVLFNLLKKKNLFFLDSLTSSDSKAKELSKEFGISYISRDYFLDNEQDLQKIIDNIDRAASTASKKGVAIAIAHPYPETLAALKLALPHLKEKGVNISPITDVIDKKL